jgi:hypothetical protein
MRVEELKDFAKCSVFHHFRHQVGHKFPKWYSYNERFDQAMAQMGYYIWHQVEDGRYPTGHLMKQAWGRAWAPGRTKEEVMFYISSWRDEAKKMERRGLRYALNMQEKFKENPGTPVLIGRDYDVAFGRTQTLQGKIDLVREIDGELQLVMFSTDPRPQTHFLKNDYAVTAAAWAAQKILTVPVTRIAIYHMPTSTLLETDRDERDYKALLRSVKTVGEAIAAKHLLPVLNQSCVGCPYLNPCGRKEWLP